MGIGSILVMVGAPVEVVSARRVPTRVLTGPGTRDEEILLSLAVRIAASRVVFDRMVVSRVATRCDCEWLASEAGLSAAGAGDAVAAPCGRGAGQR